MRRQTTGFCAAIAAIVTGMTAMEAEAGAPDPFYPDYADVLGELQDLASAFPDIVDYRVLGSSASGGLDLVAVKISDNAAAEEDEPSWVFNGFVHGSEQLGLRVVLDLATELANGYGSDADITDWVDAYEIWLVPTSNPWGYAHACCGADQETGTRKNGSTSDGIDPDLAGVDLARNYDFRWNQAPTGDTAMACTSGGTACTDIPECSRYRGPDAFSEPDTAVMRDLFLAERPVFGITYHQGNEPDGGQVMRPWSTSSCSAAPDADRLADIADLYADWVFASRGGGPFCDFSLTDPDGDGSCVNEDDELKCDELCWEPEQSRMGCYGQPSNWYYAAAGTFEYTVEISDSGFNGDYMHSNAGPASDYEQTRKDIATEFARNHVDGVKSWFDWFLTNSSEPYEFNGPGLTGHVTDALLGTPLSAPIEIAGFTSSLIEDRISDASFGRYWRLLPSGNVTVDVVKPGYQPFSTNVFVAGGALTELDIELVPDIDIILPDDVHVAWVGEPDATRSFTVRLTLGSAGEPCIGPLPFDIFVRDDTAAWISAVDGVQACVQDTYFISVQAPDTGDGSFSSDGIYDLRVELDTVSAEQADAVRYSEREEDVVFVIDVSGSMGSGGKLDAAREAATLLVNELADNDQGALVWFSGDGFEPNDDTGTPYGFQPMTVGNQIGLIGEINNLVPLSATSIGDGIVAGLAEGEGPDADPAHYCALVVLSDGMENEAAFWDDVQPQAAGSACVIHTIALGPQADETLMEEISEKGTPGISDDGSFHYATIDDSRGPLASWPNLLAGQYDDIAARIAQRQRLFRQYGEVISSTTSRQIEIDASVSSAVFALKWTGTQTAARLDLFQPDGTPVTPATPGVVYRQSATDEVYRVPSPMIGQWIARITNLGQVDVLPFGLLVSGDSSIGLRLFTSADVAPVDSGQAVKILGLLTRRALPLTGADVSVRIASPGGTVSELILYDDGQHDDGAADDGYYGNSYQGTAFGEIVDEKPVDGQESAVVGSYLVEGRAQKAGVVRFATANFSVTPSPDNDTDGIADLWEENNGLDPTDPADGRLDPDMDGVISSSEFLRGTDPQDSDTDDGGESDGSELASGRDPLFAGDDTIGPVSGFEVDPLPAGALITWTPDQSLFYTLWRRDPVNGWRIIVSQLAPTGVFEDGGLINNETYSYKMFAVRPQTGAESGNTVILDVTPVADPFPPTGRVLIDNDAASTASLNVQLSLFADADTVDMRLSHTVDEATDEVDAPWQRFATSRAWRIPGETPSGDTYRVFVQYRDSAGNVSSVIGDNILYDPDSDGDGITDTQDNCIDVANAGQIDTNSDGFGNRCDADLDDDCRIDFVDLSLFADVFFTADADADFDVSGLVNFVDLGIMAEVFFGSPGPSGLTDICD